MRDLIALNAAPLGPSLPGAGWRVWLVTTAPTLLAAALASRAQSPT